jgi:pyruvate dehydrogenase E1 component
MFDLIWAAGDMMARGFLIGGISGKTTLSGEGLQHQDGHSHHFAYAVPNLIAYDPTFAYELSVIIRDGLHRMYEKKENIFYYITVTNEFYKMPPMQKDSEEGILKGLYKFESSQKDQKAKVHLLANGAIFNEAVKARDMLESKYDIATDIWSVTSFKNLYTDAIQCERWNMLHPNEQKKIPYVAQCLNDSEAVYVAASDYMKTLPCSIAKWLPAKIISLGTDGYGRSDTRTALRNYFEVDHRFITLAALSNLADNNKIDKDIVKRAVDDFEIDVDKIDPMTV